MTEEELSPKQEAFVVAYLKSFNATEAGREAGYAHPAVEGSRLLKNPKIKARINEALDTIRQEGLGNKAVRIAELNSLYEDLKFIKSARSRRAIRRYENGEDIPNEADSGMIVETTKQIGTGANAQITTEWSFDKAWHDSAIKTLEQIAKEVGDRDRRLEISGPNGSPIQVESGKSKLFELVAADDEQES